MPKVYQVADGLTGDAHVVDDLRLVLGRKLAHRLQLHHQAAEHKQVRDVPLFQLPAFVEAFDLFLGAERYASHFQFDFNALLVNLFCQSVTAIVLDLERRAHEPVAFIFVDLSFHVFLISVYQRRLAVLKREPLISANLR